MRDGTRQEVTLASGGVDTAVDLHTERFPEGDRSQHVVRRSRPDDAPLLHEYGATREPGSGVEIVRGDHARDLAARDDVAEELVKLQTMADVEERGGLVEEQKHRLLRQRTRNRDPTFLAAAQGLDRAVREGDQIAPFKSLVDSGPIFCAFAHPHALVRRTAHRNYVAHGEARGRRLVLWNERDLARELPWARGVGVPPSDSYFPLVRCQQSRRDPEKGRLARAVGAEESNELGPVDAQRYVGNRWAVGARIAR